MSEDERDIPGPRRDDEATAAERAAEPDEAVRADAAADRPAGEDAPLVSEEGVNEGATDMARERPAREPASEED